MVVRDRLQLERLLLRVVRGEELVEDDERAVAVARGEHQALAVRRPAAYGRISMRAGREEVGGGRVRTRTCP